MTSFAKRYRETAETCKEAFKRLRTEGNSSEQCCICVDEIFKTALFPNLKELLPGAAAEPYSLAQLESMNRHYVDLRKELTSENHELFGRDFLPKMPKHLQDERSKLTQARVELCIKQPMKIDADKMIQIAINGLKLGLKDKIYGEVKICFSFVCCVRSNDLNPKMRRTNGLIPEINKTHYWLDQFPGTFAMTPSKQKDGKVYADFTNITIVKPEYYPLIEEAFRFLLSHEHANKHCYGGLKDYESRKEYGAQSKDCEWSTRVRKKMIEYIGFETAIIDRNGSKDLITETFGRRFVACCVHKEIIRFEDDLNVGNMAVDSVLGHNQGSTATRGYLRYNVRPTQVTGVILKKIDDPIILSDGKQINQGLFLQQT